MTMTVSAEDLEDLRQSAEEAARRRGHELAAWTAPPGEEGIARAAACRRCGRVAYVRAESGLVGAAGDALVLACDASPHDGA